MQILALNVQQVQGLIHTQTFSEILEEDVMKRKTGTKSTKHVKNILSLTHAGLY